MKNEKEEVVFVYADTTLEQEEIEETVELIHACDMDVHNIITQKLREVSFATYIGKGKVEEIRAYVEENEIDSVIFQQILSPLQLSNLEEIFECPVIDRSELILEIFSKRAKSKEAQLQVESARLKKILPRLIGVHTSLGRQGGGRNKGTGEKQLEIDRRRIKSKIAELDRELENVKGVRDTQRHMRMQNDISQIALVGYTNAGKSTLMNALLRRCSDSETKRVFEKDMLFATLDTTVRKIEIKGYRSFLLSDTVGFVSHLPHELIKAFHSTLEEVRYADLLIEVVDCSSPQFAQHQKTTKDTLKSIGADHVPVLTVYNKADQSTYTYPNRVNNAIYMSAKQDIGIEELLTSMESMLYDDIIQCNLLIPYEKTHIIPYLRHNSIIISEDSNDFGTLFEVKIQKKHLTDYVNYVKF